MDKQPLVQETILQELIRPAPGSGHHEQAVRKFIAACGLSSATGYDLSHITKIVRAFSGIPYENVSKIIKFAHSAGEISFRMPEEIYEDHRRWRLGGTCFSLTFYLLEILRFFEYRCYPIMGDMKWGENVHTAILLDYHGQQYLVDPGYMIHQPLRISKDTPERHIAPHTGIDIRFRPEDERFDLCTFRSGNYTWRYRFSPTPVSLDEFSRHWITSFFKPTMHGICLTRTSRDEMIYVHNDFAKISSPDTTSRLRTRNETEQIILEKFGIPMSLIEEARHALNINRRIEQNLAEHETD